MKEDATDLLRLRFLPAFCSPSLSLSWRIAADDSSSVYASYLVAPTYRRRCHLPLSQSIGMSVSELNGAICSPKWTPEDGGLCWWVVLAAARRSRGCIAACP